LIHVTVKTVPGWLEVAGFYIGLLKNQRKECYECGCKNKASMAIMNVQWVIKPKTQGHYNRKTANVKYSWKSDDSDECQTPSEPKAKSGKQIQNSYKLQAISFTPSRQSEPETRNLKSWNLKCFTFY